MIDPTDIRLGDIVQFRKQHPCGGDRWRVVRLGADIGAICLQCNRRVLLPRRDFARSVRTFVHRGEAPQSENPV